MEKLHLRKMSAIEKGDGSKSGVIEISDKRPTVDMYCHGIPPIKNW